MQGFLTNAVIAGLLLTTTLVILFGFVSQLSQDYSTTIGQQETNVFTSASVKANEIQALAYRTQQAQQNSTIDETVTDFAQLQGLAGSESEKKNAFEIFSYALQQLQSYLPFSPQVTALILAILGTLVGSAMIYLIIGRNI